MYDILEGIAQADGIAIDQYLKATLKRYGELFPDWEISTLSIEKSSDRNEQIDRVIKMLQQLKDSP